MKTTLQRTFKPSIRKALETLPEAEIEAWLRREHPEYFPDTAQNPTKNELWDQFKNRKLSKTSLDIDKTLRSIRERDLGLGEG